MGPLSLEIFNDQFRGGSPKSFAVDGRRALVNLMDQVRRAEPAIAIDVPAMPDRIKVAGIEFVEFATDEQEAVELATMLRQLGFARAARHRSEEHTSELQSLMRISYAVFCLKKQNKTIRNYEYTLRS